MFLFIALARDLTIDRGWMHTQKYSNKYELGVRSFMQFVRDHMGQECDICCACWDYLNVYIQKQDIVYDHLLMNVIMESYHRLQYHGESSEFKI